ncbi:unnamed protein product [Ilex paraguariensis]|uniref:SHSP domain-containing protein n=1 Tax=Ilex paraguariensis TaxID=185542 RepID=A0ABC8UA76_9AQUA
MHRRRWAIWSSSKERKTVAVILIDALCLGLRSFLCFSKSFLFLLCNFTVPFSSELSRMDTIHSEKKLNIILLKNCGETVPRKDFNQTNYASAKLQDEMRKSSLCDPVQMSASPMTSSLDRPCMIPLLSIPNVEENSSKASIVFTGTAGKGGTGPSIGAVDIGVSKSAYFFRVSLPGVKKDPGLFSCEIERDGKVHIVGVTSTGGRTVLKHSRVFEIKFQQQCPPGPFTLSFSLPGSVDPRLLVPNFRSDGIFEAVVAKYE